MRTIFTIILLLGGLFCQGQKLNHEYRTDSIGIDYYDSETPMVKDKHEASIKFTMTGDYSFLQVDTLRFMVTKGLIKKQAMRENFYIDAYEIVDTKNRKYYLTVLFKYEELYSIGLLRDNYLIVFKIKR